MESLHWLWMRLRMEAVEQETPNGLGKMLEYVPRGIFFLKSRPVDP